MLFSQERFFKSVENVNVLESHPRKPFSSVTQYTVLLTRAALTNTAHQTNQQDHNMNYIADVSPTLYLSLFAPENNTYSTLSYITEQGL